MNDLIAVITSFTFKPCIIFDFYRYYSWQLLETPPLSSFVLFTKTLLLRGISAFRLSSFKFSKIYCLADVIFLPQKNFHFLGFWHSLNYGFMLNTVFMTLFVCSCVKSFWFGDITNCHWILPRFNCQGVTFH